MARMVSPSVEPTITLKRGSASNCGRFSGAGNTGKASTSPAIIAAKAAVGSEMNLKVTFSSSAGVAPVVGVPHQLDRGRPAPSCENLNGPVPTGLVALVVGARRRDDHRVAPGEVEEEVALRRVEADLDRDVVDRGDLVDAVEQPFCALTEPSAIARSKEKTTSSAVSAMPSWKVTPGAQVEDPGEAVGRDLPAFGQRRQDRAVRAEAGQALEDVGVDHLVDRRRRARRSGRGSAARAACRR